MRTLHFYDKRFRFICASILAFCLTISALPRPSRAYDAGTSAVAELAGGPEGYGRVTPGVEACQPPTAAHAQTPARVAALNTARRPMTLSSPVRLATDKRPFAMAFAVPQRGVHSLVTPSIFNVPYGHRSDVGATRGGTTAVAPSSPTARAVGAGSIAAGRNMFFAAPTPPSFSKRLIIGVFTQSLKKAAPQSDRPATSPETLTDVVGGSSKPSAITPATAVSEAPVIIPGDSDTLPSSGVILATNSSGNPAAGKLSEAARPASASGERHQQADNSTEAQTNPTVKAEGRGAPYINFKDGKELPLQARESNGGAIQETNPGTSTLLASADFDSDGVADLVTADSNGTMKFYRGNLDSILPNGAQAKKHKAEGTFVDSPFYTTEKSFPLGSTPDFFVTGDFNADGKKDVLTATKGDNHLQLLIGDGRGNFAAPATILLTGKVTALLVGEIGRPDGQTDIAVAVQNDKNAQLLVFEHPEGAFKHKPEVFALPAPATDIAIGNLDEDFYSDIAIACGDQLMIVHGRGQAYPWDLVPEADIKRPAAVAAARKMSFTISALAVGRFGEKRGQTLALLGEDGNIYRLEPNSNRAPSNNKLPESARSQMKPVPFVPTDAEPRALATIADPQQTSGNADAFGMPLIDTSALKGRNLEEYLKDLLDRAAKDAPKPDQQAIAKTIAEGEPKKAEMMERAKTAFLRSLAPRPSTLDSWEMETLASGSQLAKAATATGRGQKLQRVNVSSSKLDDLMIIDGSANQIHLAAKSPQSAGHNSQFDVASLDVEGDLQAVLPMRLNIDALSDLVVLRKGATAPSVVISAPLNQFTVNSTTDSGDCIDPNPCSLRSAILLSNSSLGQDFITFDFGGAVTTITPASQLPAITDAVTFIGPTDGNNHPTVEISGANVPAPADGLKIRGSNITIQSLAVNRFQGDQSGGSQIGGNGITIESNSSSPNNGNNFLLNDYLGTDPSGTLDRGNSAAGLNIFDADDNLIGSSFPGFGNVMSGNDGAGIAMTAGNSNTFKGNIIGLNAAGNSKLRNIIGLFFSGANNTFGGVGSGDGNTVSGNGPPDPNAPGQCLRTTFFDAAAMVLATLVDVNTNELLTQNNNIKGNFFGTNPGGTLPLGNCYKAIITSPLHQTTIGSIEPGGRNIISDNGLNAIACNEEYLPESEGGFCAIAGNNIGTDVTGTIAMGNDIRNLLSGLIRTAGIVEILHNITYSYFGAPGGATPNGACTGFCNLYSSNAGLANIYFTGYGTIGIFNNYIGTNQQGNQAVPNHNVTAIHIGNALYGGAFIGAVGTDDNNAPISLGNLISGNSNGAISSFTFSFPFPGAGYFSTLTIQGNRIGTDASGILAIPNSDGGDPHPPAIQLGRGFTEQTLVGGAHSLARNIISGNIGAGIHNFSLPGVPTPVTITNNLIGVNASLNALGNGGTGIFVQNGYGLQIGGTDEEANHIAHNGAAVSNGAGIVVGRNAARIKIRNNSIHHNAGLGIDLDNTHIFFNDGGDGVTLNDTCEGDADIGANLLQNFPDLMAPVFNGDGTVTVEGVLRSTLQQHYTIELFANSSADSSDHGEGETPIGSVGVTTNGNGFASFTFTSTIPVAAGAIISATATDDYGQTSEFSCNAGASCSALSRFASLKEYLASPQEDCPTALIVTVEGDQSDEIANDGVCDIDTNMPELQCTLRAALEVITRAGYVGTHDIKFDIPGVGIHTITPASALPIITTRVSIDGSSQPGYSNAPLIELNGINAGATDGLVFAGGSDYSSVRALAINRFLNAGVSFASTNNTLTGCYIGILADGLHGDLSGRQDTGVSITGSLNRIGGATFLERNVLAANRTNQVLIATAGATTNTVIGNYIGWTVDQMVLDGGTFGVHITQDASANYVGGNTDGAQNRISGQGQGIQIDMNANANFVTHNSISENDVGIRIASASNNHIGDAMGGSVIFHNEVAGIVIASLSDNGDPAETQNNSVDHNVIGDFDGDPTHRQPIGLKIDVATKNMIGATFSNVISGNTSAGIHLYARAVDNTIRKNYVGVSITADYALPNEVGIEINGSYNKVINNLISGNRLMGILLQKEDDGAPFPEENIFRLNHVGTNDAGTVGIPNGDDGILLDGVRNHIGDFGGKNLISANGGHGIHIFNDSNTVTNNFIGTNKAGDDALGNTKFGIFIEGASNNTIRSNLVSGNTLAGIIVSATPERNNACENNIIQRNRVGTNFQGTGAIGNAAQKIGIGVEARASNTRIGGLDPDTGESAGNVISGNLGVGVFAGVNVDTPNGTPPIGTKIQGNFIGTDNTGTIAVGNQRSGIVIADAVDTLVGGFGGDMPLARNIVSANGRSGVDVSSSGSSNNRISGNYIGTAIDGVSNLGNTIGGVLIHNGAHHTIVGGTEAGAGNIVAFNKYGVKVYGGAGCCNKVDPNSIYANLTLGISLGCPLTVLDGEEATDEDGCESPLPNDPLDFDSGGNNLQNYPEFTSATINAGGNLILQYKVDSLPGNSSYGFDNRLYIEMFKADASLQGQTFLGSTYYTFFDFINGSPGIATFDAGNAAGLGIVPGDKIVATATDADGNTSEFTSVNVGVVTDQPTAAKLASFSATARDSNVLLNWRTGFEVDNLGFNVYREVDGVRTRITPQIVAGSALSDGPGTSLLSGHNYYWADTPPAGKSVRYWLEDIDLNGKSTFNGPYSISTLAPGSAAEAQKQSELISQIGMRQALLADGLGSEPVRRAATLAMPSAAALQLQSGLASQPAVKIAVKQEGYYRVTQAELLRAALDPRVDPRLLQLFVDGIEQPIKVTGEQDGRLDASDSVEFYGVGLDVASTDTRVYWLVAGTKPGKRIPITQGKGDPITSGGFPFTVERKDRTIYFSGLRNGDAENFFGAVVASQPVDQSLSIQHLDQTAQAGASLEVALQGVTKLAHNVRVQVNGTDVARLSFTGQSQGRKLVSISQSLLREGENTVRLIAEGGSSDVSLVDVIRISYSHSYVADSDALNLEAQAGRQVSISGFTRKDIRMMDVSDVGAPQEIAATVTEAKTGTTVTGTATGAGLRSLFAFSDSQAKHPWSITANQPSSLRQAANGADLLIITGREYFSTVGELKTLRESQGLSVTVVDIEDIYDEFSFGEKTPQSVKDFTAYTATNWKKKPRYVLLAGDASYDPKNYLGLGGFDLVPTKLLDTAYMETASDDWFADFNNDGVPELAVGRLPFRNAAEASTMIGKIVGYEKSSPSEEALLVADANDGFDFEAASAQLAETMPASLKVNQINRGTDTAGARARLMEAINRGQKLVNYAGHGSVNQWRGNLLVNEDAAQMTNAGHLSVFVMMTCLNGYFEDPALDSLAESLLKAERGGAVAVWSSSGMTPPGDQSRMNQEFYKSMFGPEGIALLGDAIRAAKAKSGDADIRRTWVLLGDPTMRLR